MGFCWVTLRGLFKTINFFTRKVHSQKLEIQDPGQFNRVWGSRQGFFACPPPKTGFLFFRNSHFFSMPSSLCGSKGADGAARGVIIGIAWGAIFDSFASARRTDSVAGARRWATLQQPFLAKRRPAFLRNVAASLASSATAASTVGASMARSAIGFGLFLGIYNVINCSCEVFRGRHDFVNPLVSQQRSVDRSRMWI